MSEIPHDREDHETTTVDAAAQFERNRTHRASRVSGQPHDPDDLPSPAELGDDSDA